MEIFNGEQSDRENDIIRTIRNTLNNLVEGHSNAKKDKKSESVLTRDQRIQHLLIEEKNLSKRLRKVRKQIKYYERRYQRILGKKVKHMKFQIADDYKKLMEMKQKCLELETELSTRSFESKRTEKQKSKTANKLLKVNTLTPNFKQKYMQLSREIKIKINGNEGSCSPDMHFLNDVIIQNEFINLINIVKPISLNIRECSIILQKLTEEQINKYADQKRLDQLQIEEAKQIKQDSLQNVNDIIVCPNWQIEIEKSIFEEIQNEGEKYDWNVASCSKEVI